MLYAVDHEARELINQGISFSLCRNFQMCGDLHTFICAILLSVQLEVLSIHEECSLDAFEGRLLRNSGGTAYMT